MKVVIEFYRIRDVDEAHAVVGRETVDAVDPRDAVAIARQLQHSLNMPQRPDGVTIRDGDGTELFSARLDLADDPDETPPP
jgi:hypothetical protein